MSTLSFNYYAFTVPLVPPSVNHYAKHARGGRHYTTGEAQAFKDAVATFARGGFVSAKTFYLFMEVVLGEGQRGDIDNFPKLVMDGLAVAGCFRNRKGERVSDAYVEKMVVELNRKSRPETGFTRIAVEANS